MRPDPRRLAIHGTGENRAGVDRHVAYRRLGSPAAGSEVLYLHDAGADTLGSSAFDDLACDHDVVLLDLPGYGGSSPPIGLRGTVDVVTLLEQVLDGLGWEAALVAGTSLGGWFAAELAAARPERVRGLLLAGAAGLHTPEDYLFALFADGRAAAGTERLVEMTLLDHLPPAERLLGDLPPAVAAAFMAPFVQHLAAAASCSWNPYVVGLGMLGRAAGISAPTVVQHGEHDALIPLAHGRAYAAAIPGARLDVVVGGGHLTACEDPARFAAAVRSVRAAGTERGVCQ